MKLKELQAKLDALTIEGKEAVTTGNETKAEEIKAQLDAVKAEMKAEIMFMEDEQSRALAIQTENLINNGVKIPMTKVAETGQTEPENKLDSLDYKNAVLDDLRGLATAEQLALISEINNAHSTDNAGTVIPTSTIGRIWTQIEANYPLYADVPKTRVQGNISYDKNTGTTDTGSWLLESEATPSVTFEFDTLDLTGHELSKSVDVKFKLEAMSRADFENHLVNELSKKMGKALSVAVYAGTGTKMPRGIKPTLLAEDTMQVIAVDAAGYTHLTQMFGLMASGLLAGSVIYANNLTIWGLLANIRDENGRPLLIRSVASDRVGEIFGVPVRESAELGNGEVLLGNHAEGFRWNNQPAVTTGVERDNRNRITAHFMHVIADGGVLNTKAYVLLQQTNPVLMNAVVTPTKLKK